MKKCTSLRRWWNKDYCCYDVKLYVRYEVSYSYLGKSRQSERKRFLGATPNSVVFSRRCQRARMDNQLKCLKLKQWTLTLPQISLATKQVKRNVDSFDVKNVWLWTAIVFFENVFSVFESNYFIVIKYTNWFSFLGSRNEFLNGQYTITWVPAWCFLRSWHIPFLNILNITFQRSILCKDQRR